MAKLCMKQICEAKDLQEAIELELKSSISKLREELSRKIDKSIESRNMHAQPSQPTLKLIGGLQTEISGLKCVVEDIREKRDQQLHDLSDKVDKVLDLTEKVTEMHEVFTGVKFTKKTILGLFAGLGIISGGIVAFKYLIKLIK